MFLIYTENKYKILFTASLNFSDFKKIIKIIGK